jgi:hypothetical protein
MDADVARAALARHGTTYADEAGIRLADEPSPLLQLLLPSARIGACVTVTAALVQDLKGIGPTGAAVFLREVALGPPLPRRPGARRRPAARAPGRRGRAGRVVDGDELARFAAALVLVARLPESRDPLSD